MAITESIPRATDTKRREPRPDTDRAAHGPADLTDVGDAADLTGPGGAADPTVWATRPT
ncbi:hypothetical protein ACN6K9_002129 [Streptomyces sp. SAS_267]|uniref:hypothetical protein n=1 Tax=unclassified Streptomyces TaxID=2593676 RepID=UPI0036FCFB6C